MTLADLQRVLAEALQTPDPAAALRDRPGLSAEERSALERLDPDGLALTSLVVVKLRVQQLLLSHPEMAALFRDDPEEFARRFRAYHAQVPMSDFFPAGEAERFRQWEEGRASPKEIGSDSARAGLS